MRILLNYGKKGWNIERIAHNFPSVKFGHREP